MNAFCERLGGTAVVLLSATLMAGTMALIYAGKCAPDVGFGFITAALLPMALGNHQHRVSRETKEHLRAVVMTHAADLRQHQSTLVATLGRKIEQSQEAVQNLAAGLRTAPTGRTGARRPK